MKMKIYLDNCTFNRPFDDQSQVRIRIETESKLYIQQKIKEKQLDLVWSYILDYENEQNPYKERKEAISKWRRYAIIDIEENERIIKKAKELKEKGLRDKDALHIACAIEGVAKYFITTDDTIIKRIGEYNNIHIINPTDFIREIED